MTDIRFTLKGVFLHDITKKSSRFHSRMKKRGQTKFSTSKTNEGYTLKTANLLSVKFEIKDGIEQRCWWDHHPYDDNGFCVPYSIERIDGIYHVKGPGSFCSIFCLWSYLCEETRKQYHLRDTKLEKAMELTQFIFDKIYPEEITLKEAPDWRLLESYGGPLTIVEFRKQSYDKIYVSFRNFVFDPVLIQYLTQ